MAQEAVETDKMARDAGPPRVFIVGLGQTGRELFYRLLRSIEVVGIDLNEEKLAVAKKRLDEGEAQLVKMDATSRLAWEELGIADKDVVVATARRDEVNLEVCRVVREHFNVNRLYGVIHSSRKVSDYAALGVETVSRAQVLASFMESLVLRDRRAALNIGLGQGEIIEVPVLAGSPVIGRSLSTFHARPWLVGAIYRKDQLIVPHGNTVISEGDRVVLIGEPHILSGIAEFFKLGEPGFPLQYGPRIGVITGALKKQNYQAMLQESHYLAANTKATSVALLSLPDRPEPEMGAAEAVCGGTDLSCEPAYFGDQEDQPWPRWLQNQGIGCLVVSCPKLSLWQRLGLTRSLLTRILKEAEYPVLISRGTHPYKKILAPVVQNSNPERMTELAINLARMFNARLDAITVTEPAFSAGRESVDDQRKILDRVVEYSALYRMHIHIVHLEGNPIREVADNANDYNLIVMGYRVGGRRFRPKLDLALEIMSRVSCSVMLLPFREEG